jgi:ribosomal protein S18 acetylase RimI-like enzyme
LIRPLEGSDFDALVELFKVVFPIKYKNEFLDAWLARAPAHSFGVFGEGLDASGGQQLLAFLVSTQKGDGLLQIEFLGVSPLCQKGGFGTVLLGKVLEFCRKTNSRATLVPVNDPRIISWYKKHGFDFYGSPKVSPYTGEMEHAMLFPVGACAPTGTIA